MRILAITLILFPNLVFAKAKGRDFYLIPRLDCTLHLSDAHWDNEKDRSIPNSESHKTEKLKQGELEVKVDLAIGQIGCSATAMYNAAKGRLEIASITILSHGSVWASRGPKDELDKSALMSLATDNTYAQCSCAPHDDVIIEDKR